MLPPLRAIYLHPFQSDTPCSKVEFIRSFFGRIHGLAICFPVLLIFTKFNTNLKFGVVDQFIDKKKGPVGWQRQNEYECDRPVGMLHNLELCRRVNLYIYLKKSPICFH